MISEVPFSSKSLGKSGQSAGLGEQRTEFKSHLYSPDRGQVTASLSFNFLTI